MSVSSTAVKSESCLRACWGRERLTAEDHRVWGREVASEEDLLTFLFSAGAGGCRMDWLPAEHISTILDSTSCSGLEDSKVQSLGREGADGVRDVSGSSSSCTSPGPSRNSICASFPDRLFRAPLRASSLLHHSATPREGQFT